MDALTAAAAVTAMDIDDNAGEDSQLGSTSATVDVTEDALPAIESIAVDKENASGAPANQDPEAANPKVDSATRMPRSSRVHVRVSGVQLLVHDNTNAVWA